LPICRSASPWADASVLSSSAQARLGASVTGIDLSEKPLKVAQLHLLESGLAVHYELVSAEEKADLSDELMDYILESEHKEKVKYRWMWQMVTGIAASVIVVMLSVNYYNSRMQWKDTFTDPQEAYAEASKTLNFVAGKYNQGLAQLRPIGKIESAVNPLNSGMKKLNKGFDQMNELNEKLKKE